MQPKSNANPLFPAAFFSYLKSGRYALFVYSKADRTYWDFEEKFSRFHKDAIASLGDSFNIFLIENANHVLSFREWEQQVHEIVASWLERRFLLNTANPTMS